MYKIKQYHCIFDWKVVTPKGKTIVFRNDKIEKRRRPFSSKI